MSGLPSPPGNEVISKTRRVVSRGRLKKKKNLLTVFSQFRRKPTVAMIPIIANANITPRGPAWAFVVGAGVGAGKSAAFIWSAWPALTCSVLVYGLYPASSILIVEEPGCTFWAVNGVIPM